jgi:hypothetical protein
LYRRVGFSESQEKASITLPNTTEFIHRDWEVVEHFTLAPSWDFLWNATVEEGREKSLLGQAFTTNIEEMPLIRDKSSELVHVAESALKVRHALFVCMDMLVLKVLSDDIGIPP